MEKLGNLIVASSEVHWNRNEEYYNVHGGEPGKEKGGGQF